MICANCNKEINQQDEQKEEYLTVRHEGKGEVIGRLHLNCFKDTTIEPTIKDLVIKIIGCYKKEKNIINEPLDSDEAELLASIIHTEIDFHEGNITEEEYNKTLSIQETISNEKLVTELKILVEGITPLQKKGLFRVIKEYYNTGNRAKKIINKLTEPIKKEMNWKWQLELTIT